MSIFRLSKLKGFNTLMSLQYLPIFEKAFCKRYANTMWFWM